MPELDTSVAGFGLRTTAPVERVKLESSKLVAPTALPLLARRHVPAPKMSPPIVRVDSFGAKGDGLTDDTAAIRRAVASMSQGGTLVFTEGRIYRKREVVIVEHPDVTLWGYGAILYTVVTDDEASVKAGSGVAIHLRGARDALYGLTITSNLRTRPIGHPNESGVVLAGEDQTVMDNRFEYVGIFAENARHFTIARNVVYRCVTDGIHTTNNSSDGQVLSNVVRQTGDDLIAVVNYGLGEPTMGRVLIEGNDVAGNYWGRGISVVGGQDVVIRDNKIDRTQAAAVMVHSETSWSTANVRRVVVEKNRITNMEVLPIEFDPIQVRRHVSGHAAIDVFGQGNQQVSDVLVRDNTITRARSDGVFVRGNACRVRVSRNTIVSAGDSAIHIETNRAEACPVVCDQNKHDGKPVAPDGCLPSGSELQQPRAPHVSVAGPASAISP
ncbi:MAG: h16 [Myxococcaceae bacterium]|nr:h16 [Myxococcaceae bacterium]